MMYTGDRVRIRAGEFANATATVVQDQYTVDRVYVLIDGAGHNPVRYRHAELESLR